MPRESFLPSDEQRRTVEAMAAYGVPETDIALVLGIDPKTLRKHFRDELDTGHVKANSKVAETLWKIATDARHRACVTAAIFWMKTRAGWSEYAPPPKARAPGKKEQAQRDAETAAQGTSWSDLVH